MKRLIPLLALAMLFSCQPKPKKAILTGTLIEPSKEYIIIYSDNEPDTVFLDSIGNFRKEIFLEKPSYYFLRERHDKAIIYLCPGDELSLSVNLEEFDESLQYAGIGEIPNNYLAAANLLDKMMIDVGIELFIMEEEEFKHYIDSVKIVKEDFLKNAGIDSRKYKEFLRFEDARIYYEWVARKINYPSYHKYYSKNEAFRESRGYFDFLDEIKINNAEFMVLPEYKGFVDTYLGREVFIKYENDEAYKDIPNGYYYAKLDAIDDLITDPDLKLKMLKKLALDVVNMRGVDDTDSLLNIFYSKCNDTAYTNEIHKAVKAWEILARGKTAPGFTYKDIDGNMVSLSDFKGKYVYIDVWATWCGPCKAETPALKELVKEYEGKNIVFISISVDRNVNAWKKMVEENEMNWVQLISENAWNTKITEDYLIKGIPRFILIDPDGNIVSANAPRPSGKIKEIFQKHGL